MASNGYARSQSDLDSDGGKPPRSSAVVNGDLDSDSAAMRQETPSSAVLDARLRDLRRLDFAFNKNEELAVQVRYSIILSKRSKSLGASYA